MKCACNTGTDELCAMPLGEAVCDYLRAYSHAIDDVAMKCVADSVIVAAVAARSLLKRVQCPVAG